LGKINCRGILKHIFSFTFLKKLNSWLPRVSLFLVLFALSAIADQRAIVNFHLDIPRYLYEGELVAKGLVPYRDFTWQYPPASVYLLGWWFKWFGIGFQQAAIFLSAVSSIIALMIYSLCRRAGCGQWAALGIVLYVIFFSWQSCQSEFFSLNVYTGALLIGWAFALSSVRFLQFAIDSCGLRQKLFFSLTSLCLTGAILSKQEAAMASLLTLGFMTLVQFLSRLRLNRQSVSIKTETTRFVPNFATASIVFGLFFGICTYYALGKIAGWDNLKQGLEGYGLAGFETGKLIENIPNTVLVWLNSFGKNLDFLLLVLATCSLFAVIFQWKRFFLSKWLFLAFSATVLVSVLWRHQFVYPGLFIPWVLESTSLLISIFLPIFSLFLVLASIWQACLGACPLRINNSLPVAALLLVCTLLLSRFYLEGPHFRASAPSSLAGVIFGILFVFPDLWISKTGYRRHSNLPYKEFRICNLLLIFLLGILSAYFYKTPGIRTGHACLPISKIETDRGVVFLSKPESNGFSELISYSRKQIKVGDSVAVLPYSCGINFLLDRPNPYIQTQFEKNQFKGELASRINNREKTAFPSYIVVQKLERPRWNRVYDLSEVYSQNIWRKLRGDYELVQTFGDVPKLGFELYRIKNLQRNPTP
jgi:hypothetical protein